MRLKILLINPWIYDFAAYNLWSRPLGLIQVGAYLGSYDTDLFLIDCTDAFEPGQFGKGKFRTETVDKPEVCKGVPRLYKRYGIAIDEFVSLVKGFMPFDVVLMTSIMSYWYPAFRQLSNSSGISRVMCRSSSAESMPPCIMNMPPITPGLTSYTKGVSPQDFISPCTLLDSSSSEEEGPSPLIR